MKKLIPVFIGAVTFIVCLLVSALVWAQSGDAPATEPAPFVDRGAVTQATELAFQILTPIVTIFATWLAHRIVKTFESKTGIDIPDKQESKIDTWIEEGIHLAAEKSYNKVKEKTDKLRGPEKLEAAADFVFAMANQRGWADWTKDAIKAKIEAAMGMHRANGGVPKLEDKAEAGAEG